MKASVVIATYNRAPILRRCLEALRLQTSADFEVIVVDDGGEDDTAKAATDFAASLSLRYLRQENQGQGKARNLGIQAAANEIIVFINDDILVDSDFIRQHLAWHRAHPDSKFAVLGFIDWHRESEPTPFMHWLTNGSSVLGRFGGQQFAFEKLAAKERADYNFFYTSNLSLKKSLLECEQFSPAFDLYGWEDIELGYRLEKNHGMILLYNPAAIAYHHHKIGPSDFQKRMKMVGAAARIFDSLHPEVKKSPGFWKKLIFHFLAGKISLKALAALKNEKGGKFFALYHYALSKKYFLQGWEKGDILRECKLKNTSKKTCTK